MKIIIKYGHRTAKSWLYNVHGVDYTSYGSSLPCFIITKIWRASMKDRGDLHSAPIKIIGGLIEMLRSFLGWSIHNRILKVFLVALVHILSQDTPKTPHLGSEEVCS